MNSLIQSNRSLRRLFGAMGCVGVLATGGFVTSAQADVEKVELKVALEAARTRIEQLESTVLELEKNQAQLGQALAAANAEADQFRESYRTTREEMEAFGLTAIDRSEDSIQARLLKALADLRIAEEQSRDLTAHIVTVHQAVAGFLETSVSPDQESVANLELALGEALDSVSLDRFSNAAGNPTVHQARIVSMKPNLDLIVLDVGRSAGAKPGMPFRILRKDRPVATALLVDVRDSVSGAIVQNVFAEGESIRLGDIAKIDTQQSF